MEKVFISYSTKDASIADMLCSKLTGADIEYWFAPKDIPVGEYTVNISYKVFKSVVVCYLFFQRMLDGLNM